MTNETIPELPDWVKVLINDARQEGYNSGLRDGGQQAAMRLQAKAEVEFSRW